MAASRPRGADAQDGAGQLRGHRRGVFQIVLRRIGGRIPFPQHPIQQRGQFLAAAGLIKRADSPGALGVQVAALLLLIRPVLLEAPFKSRGVDIAHEIAYVMGKDPQPEGIPAGKHFPFSIPQRQSRRIMRSTILPAESASCICIIR